MEAKKLEEAAERMLAQPKAVEVDGQRVENQSVGELLRASRYLAAKDATGGRKCPLRVNKMLAGGAV